MRVGDAHETEPLESRGKPRSDHGKISEFECPEKLDLDRDKPGRHLAFGSGIHHCLGAPLARRELYWSFKALVDRVEDMRFVPGANDFTIAPNFALRALKELHIEFTAKQ